MSLVYKLNRILYLAYRKNFINGYRKSKKLSAPTYVLWDCTRKCNLNCEHCGASDKIYRDELSTDEIKSVIADISEMGTKMFPVIGGEPFLREYLLDVLEYANLKGLHTGIASNGFFIDSTVANKLRQIGVTSVQISLDGVEDTHNKIRKNNLSYRKATEAIRNLIDNNIKIVQVATTVTKKNIDELESIYSDLLALNVPKWRIGILMPIGRALESDIDITIRDVSHVMDFIVTHNNNGIDISVTENIPFLFGYETSIRESPVVCPAGITLCCIGVSGNIRGCAEQPDIEKFIEGNVREISLKDIWQRQFRMYRNGTVMFEDPKCAKCKYRYSCFGGCYAMREKSKHCFIGI